MAMLTPAQKPRGLANNIFMRLSSLVPIVSEFAFFANRRIPGAPISSGRLRSRLAVKLGRLGSRLAVKKQQRHPGGVALFGNISGKIKPSYSVFFTSTLLGVMYILPFTVVTTPVTVSSFWLSGAPP